MTSSRYPTGLTQVNICEAFCGDGISRVFVNVLQAKAGKLWFVEEPGLQGTVCHHPALRQDLTCIPWLKTCHKFQVSGPAECHPNRPGRFSLGSQMSSKTTHWGGGPVNEGQAPAGTSKAGILSSSGLEVGTADRASPQGDMPSPCAQAGAPGETTMNDQQDTESCTLRLPH